MTKPRQNPVHYQGDLRADLIREALQVIADEGTAGVSLRALTRRLGVSHAAPKNHFATKELLFAEIAREGFVMFEAGLREAGDRARLTDPDPMAAVEAQSLAYLDFARDNPSHFALMFRTDLFDPALIQQERAKAFAVLNDGVKAAQLSGWKQGADGQTAAGLLWSVVHGQAHLEAQGMPIGGNIGDRAAGLRLLLDR